MKENVSGQASILSGVRKRLTINNKPSKLNCEVAVIAIALLISVSIKSFIYKDTRFTSPIKDVSNVNQCQSQGTLYILIY